LHGTVQDISERMRLTMQIRSSERRLQQVVEATSDGFWDWDLRTGYVYRSARYFSLTGYAPEDDTHNVDFFRKILFSDDVEIWQQALTAHLRGETSLMEFDIRLVTRSGELRWVRVRAGRSSAAKVVKYGGWWARCLTSRNGGDWMTICIWF
jgi:PAS domain S-box-containing protein